MFHNKCLAKWGLGAALKAAYLAGESPVPGIAYLPG
jgi:hypothetical protein